jgi:GNAT superfamily N-acetyltransferase
MTGALPIHRLGLRHIPAALPLSAEPGWNQVEADWRLMIEHGDSFGISTADGHLVATGLTVLYDGPFGWISMILVTEAYRRRGLATRLMEACTEALEAKGTVPALDASPEGREVYLHLGFEDVYRTTRLFTSAGRTAVGGAVPPVPGVRGLEEADLDAVNDYDRKRNGAERAYMLKHLRKRLPQAAFVAEREGGIAGYVMARDGRLCAQIGPLVAEDEATALALLQHALGALPEGVCLDLGDHHAALRGWLDERGFQPITHFVRMIKGRRKPYDDPALIYAIAGPELG